MRTGTGKQAKVSRGISAPVSINERQRTVKILFLIRSLGFGGAERQLVNIAKGFHERGHQIVVVTFYSGGALEKELINANVGIETLGKRSRWDLMLPMIRIIRLVRRLKPAVMYGYLPSENLVVVAAKAAWPSAKVVWGIQASNMDLSQYDWFTRAIYAMQSYVVRFADLIISNSHAGRDYYIARGFPELKIRVIHNPIDADRFKPDLQARKKVRSEWGIESTEKLIGIVARLDPMKDHPTFLKAAALLAQRHKDVRFICVGDGPAKYRDALRTLSTKMGLSDRLIWASACQEIECLYNALDVLVSSSAYGEGCSNVLSEAMACGVPCVATDVGDNSLIVSTAGMVVPPSDARVLADAVDAVLARARIYSSAALHQQIAERFGKEKMVLATEEQLSRIVCP
jgi:glycosyltransferase involved in cell wall biosynthesis